MIDDDGVRERKKREKMGFRRKKSNGQKTQKDGRKEGRKEGGEEEEEEENHKRKKQKQKRFRFRSSHSELKKLSDRAIKERLPPLYYFALSTLPYFSIAIPSFLLNLNI